MTPDDEPEIVPLSSLQLPEGIDPQDLPMLMEKIAQMSSKALKLYAKAKADEHTNVYTLVCKDAFVVITGPEGLRPDQVASLTSEYFKTISSNMTRDQN